MALTHLVQPERGLVAAGSDRHALMIRTSLLAAGFTAASMFGIWLGVPKAWSLSAAVLGIACAATPGALVATAQLAWAERWQAYFAAVAALLLVILDPMTAAPALGLAFVVPAAQAWARVTDVHARWPVPIAVSFSWMLLPPVYDPSTLKLSGALALLGFAISEVIRLVRIPQGAGGPQINLVELPRSDHRILERLEASEVAGDLLGVDWFFANLVDNHVEFGPRALALLELDPATPLSWTDFLGLHGEEARQGIFRAIRAAMGSGESVTWAGKLTLPNGNEVAVKWKARARVQAGAIVLVGAVADRTSNDHLETELRRTGLAMDAMLEHAPVVLSRMAADGSVTEFRGAGLRRMGVADDEVLGTNPMRSRKESKTAARIRRALDGETVVYRSVGGPKEARWSFRTFLFPDPTDGSGVIAVSIDETEIFTAEKRLQASENRFNLAVRGAAVGIWDLDIAGENLYLSDRIAEMLGIEPEQLDPEWLAEQWPTAAQRLRDTYTRHVEDSEPFALDLQLGLANGKRVGLAVQGAAVLDKEGKPTRMAGSVTDITGRIQAARQLEAQVERAESANRAKSQFVTNMSHELRTPMNAIVGMSQLMARTRLDAEQRGYCEVINRASDELLDLIEDVLDISKIEAGAIDFDIVGFDPTALVRNIVRVQQHHADDKDLALEVCIDEAVPERLRGDPTRIRQVVTNLTHNAIKFTETGVVRVQVGHDGVDDEGRILLAFEVTDTGIGIPEDHLDTIFEKFAQVDGSWSRRRGGTGLGLAIARQLSRKMGGDITVESRLGAGSRFRVVIPLPLPDEVAAPETPAERVNSDVARVLVVEDNHVNQRVIERMLQVLGHDADVVGDGHAARSAIKRNTYDLVLMDIQMPGLDGLTATRQIRAEERHATRHIPIIALTAHATLDDRARCFEAGMDGFVTKPVRLDVLRGEIDRVLDGAQAEAQIA
jgi:PAS domain S-box-containing protein